MSTRKLITLQPTKLKQIRRHRGVSSGVKARNWISMRVNGIACARRYRSPKSSMRCSQKGTNTCEFCFQPIYAVRLSEAAVQCCRFLNRSPGKARTLTCNGFRGTPVLGGNAYKDMHMRAGLTSQRDHQLKKRYGRLCGMS